MMHWNRKGLQGTVLAAAVALVAPSTVANAATLTLTPQGIAAGFTLTTFATMYPGYNSCCDGPFGLTMAGNGNVIVSMSATGLRYVFADVDGQSTGYNGAPPSTALATAPTNSFTGGYAFAGGKPYGSQNGQFVQFNDDGTVNHVLTGVTTGPYLGMWGNPIDGHIIATSGAGLIDIDPLANGGNGSFRVINGQFGDGVSVSPDGTVAYLEQGNIVGYNILTGAQVASFNSGCVGPDGTGVITSNNALNGQIVVNCNDGNLMLIDPGTGLSTLIASGGTRGDYTAPDVTNGSLLLDAADVVYRLSCGPDCAIGGPVVGTPEPASMTLLGLGLVGLGYRRKRSAKRA